MDRLAALSEGAVAFLERHFMLVFALLILILAFAMYVYITPNAPLEGFKPRGTDKKIPAIINRVR
jgi:hypothetical protein